MAIKFNRSQTFATNGTVTAAGLHNLIDGTDIYQALITDQTNLTSVGTADELLIADADLTAGDAPRAVTVQALFESGLTAGTYVGLNLTGALTYGTATGNRTVSTSATITTGTIPNLTAGTTTSTVATIPTLTAGTTTSTAANITNGTIQTLTSSTATITGGTFSGLLNSSTGTFSGSVNSTSGTIGTLNATTGTISNLSTTLAGDFTISQGTGTIGTGTITAAKLANPQYTGFRNRIINGDMRIDQRNAGASVTPTNGQYLVDRFGATLTQASKFTAQQNAGSITPPTGFTNYLGITSSSSYSVLAGDTFGVYQYIEGFNTADLAWGTASASAITLSFWVRSSLTGTFGGALTNNAQNRSYPFSYTISSANTWTKATITITGDTSGTWATDNSVGIGLRFGLGSGSTYSGTSGAWAAGNFIQPTSTVSVVGTNGATFYITGVQLEAGSTATEFERRPYGTELALCQRYFIRYTNRAMGTMNGASHLYNGSIAFPVTMRSAPTLVAGASFSVNTGSDGTPALDPTSTNNSAITTADQAIFWNSSSNWTSNNFASITCSLTSEL